MAKTSIPHVTKGVQIIISQGGTEEDVLDYVYGKGYPTRESYVNAVRRYKTRLKETGGIEKDHGFFDSIMQGLTFGFSDEIASAISAGGVSGPAYEQELAARKFARQDYEELHPGRALAAEILGGVAPGLATGGAGLALAGGRTALKQGTKMGLGKLAATEAGVGAAGGGIAGAGSSDPGERLKGAALGATLGAGAGTVLPIAGKALGTAITKGRQGIGLMSKTEAEEIANMKFIRALEDDDMTPQNVIDKIDANLELDPAQSQVIPFQGRMPEGAIDVAGENVLGMARVAQAIPSKSKEMGRRALRDRAEGQYERVSDYLIEASGREAEDVFGMIDDIIRVRKEKSGPLYEAAFEVEALDSPVVNDLLDSNLMKSSVSKARRSVGPGDSAIDIEAPVSFDNLHMIKVSLDDEISKAYRVGETNHAAKLRDAKNILLDEMERANPAYRAARQVYAGASELKDALESGMDFWKKDPRLTRKAVDKLSQSEKDMFLSGAMDSIRQLMDRANDGRDIVKVIFGNRQFRSKIEAVLKDDMAFQRLRDQMTREANARRTQDVVLGGSQTARIQQEIKDLHAQAPQILADLLIPGGTGTPLATRVAGPVVQKAQQLRQGKVADALAPKLFKLQPQAQKQTMRDLIGFQQELQRRGDLSNRNLIYGAGATGTIPGLLVD